MLVIQGCLFIYWHQQRWTVPWVFRRIEMERLVLSFKPWQNSKYCTQNHNTLGFFCTCTCSWHSSQSVSTAAKAQTKAALHTMKTSHPSMELLSSMHQDVTIPTCFMAPALRSGPNQHWNQKRFSPFHQVLKLIYSLKSHYTHVSRFSSSGAI